MFKPPNDTAPDLLINARLPSWLLPSDWPSKLGQPELADVGVTQGCIASVTPCGSSFDIASNQKNLGANIWDLAGFILDFGEPVQTINLNQLCKSPHDSGAFKKSRFMLILVF